MTLEQIECFVTVAASGSINQAAQQLYRSQPNLSYSLKQLELELGYQLLNRTSLGVTLTREGTAFLEQAQSTLQQFRQLQSFVRGNAAKEEHTLRVSAMPFCRASEALLLFYGKRQGPTGEKQEVLPVDFAFSSAMRDELVSDLVGRRFDLGIAYAYAITRQAFLRQVEMHGLAARELCKCRAAALVGRGCPYYERETVTLEELAQLNRVYFARRGIRSLSYSRHKKLTQCAGTILSDDRQTIRFLLNTLPCFNLAPASEPLLDGRDVGEGLRYLPVKGLEIAGSYYAISRKDEPLPQAAGGFLTILEGLLRGEEL